MRGVGEGVRTDEGWLPMITARLTSFHIIAPLLIAAISFASAAGSCVYSYCPACATESAVLCVLGVESPIDVMSEIKAP